MNNDQTDQSADDIVRLNESNAERRACKLGTKSTSVWIYEADFPLSKGDVIRYAEKLNGKPTKGRVIADPEGRYLFIGVDATAPLIEDSSTLETEGSDR